MKLQKFMAHAGVASRRKSEEMIEKGRVQVNGTRAHIGQVVEPGKDTIEVDGKVLSNADEPLRYFLVDKPVGIVSTTSDELGRETVLSLIPRISERLYPVGRLDKDSSGLMLLTNDGDLANKMTHPKYEVKKTYRVEIAGRPTYAALSHLERGVRLSDGYTQPAFIELLNSSADISVLEITIHEGRNHQVRRMMERIGYPVVTLERVVLGPFELVQLEGKRYLELTADEVAAALSGESSEESTDE